MGTESLATTSGKLSPQVELALDRNRLAYERTMMAWIRTATSLISFGFTIYKFFDFFQKDRVPTPGLIGPRGFAMIMIGIGLFTLIGAIAQRWTDSRNSLGAGRVRNSFATIVAILVGVMGVLTFIAVLYRQ